jgi:hypothetical protein
MDEEQRQQAILKRLMEMGIQVDKPIFTLIWQDVTRVMVETEGFEMASDFPTDVLVNMLNTIEDGLEYLDWYSNLQNSICLTDRAPLASNQATTEGGHLESDYHDRISTTDGEEANDFCTR